MSGMKMTKLLPLTGGLLLAAIAVSGCRSEEQNRPLFFEKGTYQGTQDQELSDDKLDELRQRARNQG